MINIECDTWPEFYSRYRIEPYLRKAVDQGKLTRRRLGSCRE